MAGARLLGMYERWRRSAWPAAAGCMALRVRAGRRAGRASTHRSIGGNGDGWHVLVRRLLKLLAFCGNEVFKSSGMYF